LKLLFKMPWVRRCNPFADAVRKEGGPRSELQTGDRRVGRLCSCLARWRSRRAAGRISSAIRSRKGARHCRLWRSGSTEGVGIGAEIRRPARHRRRRAVGCGRTHRTDLAAAVPGPQRLDRPARSHPP